MHIEIISDLKECEALWKQFFESKEEKEKTMFDLWEYRACFFDDKHFKLHFIAVKENKEKNSPVIGLLPLWFYKDKGYHEFFGGEFVERNKFMAKNKEAIDAMLCSLPEETFLEYIDESEAGKAELKEMDLRYVLNFKDYNNSIENYLDSFSKKHRKNLKYDLKQFEKINYVVVKNQLEDFERLVDLNKQRWNKGSFFGEKWFLDGFKKMMDIAQKRNELCMLSIEINGKVEAVEVAINHNGIYHVLLGGNNLDVQNVGKLLTIMHMKHSLAIGARTIDFLSTDSGWKKLWRLTEEKVYHFTNSKYPEE